MMLRDWDSSSLKRSTFILVIQIMLKYEDYNNDHKTCSRCQEGEVPGLEHTGVDAVPAAKNFRLNRTEQNGWSKKVQNCSESHRHRLHLCPV